MNQFDKISLYKKVEKALDYVNFHYMKNVDREDSEQMLKECLWLSLDEIDRLHKEKGLSLYASAIRLTKWKALRQLKIYNNDLIRIPAWLYKKENKEKCDRVSRMNDYKSIYENTGEKDNMSFENIYLGDDNTAVTRLERRLNNQFLKKRIDKVLSLFPFRTTEIIKHRYELDDYEYKTLKQLAERFEISVKRVSQIEINFLNRAQKYLKEYN